MQKVVWQLKGGYVTLDEETEVRSWAENSHVRKCHHIRIEGDKARVPNEMSSGSRVGQ